MKMSEAVEWALHCVTVLSVLPAGAALPAKALAEYHGVSESYLLKNLKLLTAVGILESVSGPKGGYCMGRDPEKVTLLEVVEAVEGTEPIFPCADIRERVPFACPPDAFRHTCAIHAAMLKAEHAYRQSLRQQTIADITAQLMKTVHPGLAAQGGRWLRENLRQS